MSINIPLAHNFYELFQITVSKILMGSSSFLIASKCEPGTHLATKGVCRSMTLWSKHLVVDTIVSQRIGLLSFIVLTLKIKTFFKTVKV